MKRLLLLIATLGLSLSVSSCANRAWTPASMSAASSVYGEPVQRASRQQHTPQRIYRDGRWLTYRMDGYYYYDMGRWIAVGSYPYYRTPYMTPYPYDRGWGSRGWGTPRPQPQQPAPDSGRRVYRR